MNRQQPKIPNQLEVNSFEELLYEEDSILELCEINGEDVSDKIFERARLYQVSVKNCKFIHTDFSRVDLTDVIFENCDFSNANLENASIYRVVFKNCKLLGCKFPESY